MGNEELIKKLGFYIDNCSKIAEVESEELKETLEEALNAARERDYLCGAIEEYLDIVQKGKRDT